MDEIIQNSYQSRAEALPSHSHAEFIELCVLSTAEALTEEEWARLRGHLPHCASCREIKQQYELLITEAIPVLAAASMPEQDGRPLPTDWSLDQAQARLLKNISAEPLAMRTLDPLQRKARWGNGRHWILAAVLLLTSAAILYLFKNHGREHVVLKTVPQAVISETMQPPIHFQSDANAYRRNQHDRQIEIARLREVLGWKSVQLDRLRHDNAALQRSLAERTEDLNRAVQNRAETNQQLLSKEAEIADLQDRFGIDQKHASEQLEAAQNENLGLHAAIHEGGTELAQDEELLKHDHDIRDLIGARNLYIAEIYDVAKNGSTQKPFGRVFYTKEKSLIFYGYDLDQQPGLKSANTFQAWGRSGSGERDVSLGIFYQDDANKKRWILKCNDPQTLARLDAIFVTVEPKGGSEKPTGKPLLFTYLRIEPNHP